jgi:catabolite repression HPr-like protein
MGMMSLVLTSGAKVTVVAEGDDEEKAVDAMEDFLTA